MFFHTYPYTDAHELNLDWILAQIKSINSTLNNFIVMNTIKYADPFQWNITTQYESNTIVMEPNTGVAYISVQPVPAGISISNTSYWTPVFDLSQMFSTYNDNITFNNEHLNIVSQLPYNEGEWLIWKNDLYLVVSEIHIGDALQPGINIERKSVEDLVNDLENKLTLAIGTVDGRVDATNTRIDNVITRIDNNHIINVLEYDTIPDALAACNAGYTLYFPSGTYTWTDELIIDKAINIVFNDVVINHNSTPSAMIRLSHDDIYITGKAEFNGILADNNYFILGYPGYKNIIIDLDCDVNDYINVPLITLVNTNNVILKGNIRCHDGRAILCNGCSHVNVSGVTSEFTTNCSLGVVVFTDSDDTHTYDDITIHDCNLNGNDHTTDGLLVVTRSNADSSLVPGYLPITNVKILNNIVSNGTGATDGIDAVLVDNCIIKGNVVSGCLEGIAVLGNVFEITDNIISDCDSAGIVIGDYNIGTGLTHSAITIGHNIIANCGTSLSGDPWIVPAAIGAKQQNGNYIATVYIDNNQLINCPHGFYLDSNVGGSNIALSDNFILSTIAPISVGDLSQMSMFNNRGLNPTGPLTIGNPDTSLTNTFGCPIELTFRADTVNETTVSIDGNVFTIIPVNAFASFTLDPGQSITLSETPQIWAARGI